MIKSIQVADLNIEPEVIKGDYRIVALNSKIFFMISEDNQIRFWKNIQKSSDNSDSENQFQFKKFGVFYEKFEEDSKQKDLIPRKTFELFCYEPSQRIFLVQNNLGCWLGRLDSNWEDHHDQIILKQLGYNYKSRKVARIKFHP